MYANIIEKSNTVGLEVANAGEVIVPWTDLASFPEDQTISDVLMMLGFTTIGTWSRNHGQSRVLVRPIKKS